jgi:hypothetical protein
MLILWGIILNVSAAVTSTRPPHMKILGRTGQKSRHSQDRWNSYDTQNWGLDLWQAVRNLSLWGMFSKEVLCFQLIHSITGVIWIVHCFITWTLLSTLFWYSGLFVWICFTGVYNCLLTLLAPSVWLAVCADFRAIMI